MTTSLIQATRNLQCDAGIKTNTINTATNANMAIQRNNIEFIRLDTAGDNITCSKEIVGGGGIKCNTLDSDGDSDVLFKRNNSTYITFTSDKIELAKSLRCGNALIIDSVEKLTMRPSTESGIRIFDIRNLHPVVDNPMIRFRVGEGGGSTIVAEMTNSNVRINRNLKIEGAYRLQTNIIDTNGNNDLIFKRNDVEYMRLQGSDLTVRMNYPLVLTNLYANNHYPTAYGFDTVFYGSSSLDDAYLEYFRFNHASESCDFNVPIDNTGISITGNIVDTTVSDERLKTNIEDVECNFTECVKNVKVKTFEYTNEKYKDNDKYGFIAQHLLQNLPKEFKSIVKENKEKDSDDKLFKY